jgi:hypothetical protein
LLLLHIAGGLLMALSGIVFIFAARARGKTQKPLSNRDYVVFCGATLGLLLGFILIAYAPPQ